MPCTAWRCAAIASLLAYAPAIAATRPRYGGTLHAQIHARLTSLDPREHDAASGKLAALVFETLVTLDDAAQIHPALAVSWRHDSDFRRWELQLRTGVRFQDGSSLTAPVAAAALAPMRVLVLGESLVFFSEQPAPKLLFTLANPAHSILKQAPDGSPVGTGPFRAEKWEPGKHAVFAANEDYWGGRPYLDAVELEMGRTTREQLLDFELGKADLVEIAFGDVRRASQNGRRLWTSASLDLLALVFDSEDQRLREAIALSIDRPAISSVLLQNQGEPAGGLLPTRISGYGFLFPPLPHDLDRARKLAADLPRNTPPALAYDPADPVAKAVADRMAVNAREAGIMLRPIAAVAAKGAAARLVRARVSSLDPEQAFAALLSSLGVEAAPHQPTLEGLYAAERALIDGYRVVPLFRLPEVFGLGVRVRNWSAWKLDSVWLGPGQAMTFRSKLLIAFAATVLVAVGVDSLIVEENTRSEFERLDSQRTSALVAQLRREFDRRQQEVVRKTERIASLDTLGRMAAEADYAAYLDEAQTLAVAQGLDFVELTAPDGAIISSAQWPARYGYKDEWVSHLASSGIQVATLKAEQLPDEVALALVAVRAVTAGDKSILVAGGQKLDKDFLALLDPPEGMRVLLYRNLQPAFSSQALTGKDGPVPGAEKFEAIISEAKRGLKDFTRAVGVENFQVVPLFGRDKDLLAVLLIGSSRAGMLKLERFIRDLGFAVGAMGVLLGLALAWWATARITRPVRELAAAAGEVAGGNWNARVDVQSSDEIGGLARAFNEMTRQLTEQRERLVQSERVAAWRELARRLAHELKNPLFPLQITVENMQRARDRHPEQFDEVFREGSATLLAELANLKTIINRFSDFSKMPPPERQPSNVNEIVRAVMKLFEPQLAAQHVTARMELDETLPAVQADPAQLHRALQNLVLNALDAMPSGGLLVARSARAPGAVRLEISDSGSGLTKEECERLFTPYYTTKQHGTGLGLAIVQSVVSDHGGRISVESEPGRGATFRIELQNGESSHR